MNNSNGKLVAGDCERMSTEFSAKRLKFCDLVIMGQSPDGASVNIESNGVPFLQGNAEFGKMSPVATQATTDPRKFCQKGDVLLSVRAPVGAVNIADQTYAIGRGLCAIRPRLHDGIFLQYLLKTQVETLNSFATGTTFTAVSAPQVGQMSVPFPTLSEQRHIVAYLDEQTAKIDRLMEMRRRQMALLKEQRAALIQEAVTRGLNPNAPMKDSGVPWIRRMPQEWQLLPLRAVLTERGEFNKDLRTTDFLSVIKDVGVVPYDERVATGNRKSDSMEKYKIIHPGDIVANRMNLIFGSVGLSAHFGCSSTEYYALRGRDASVDTRFYGLIFQSKGFQRSLVGIGSGILAHRMRIYYEALKKVMLPVPPVQQQQEIVNFVGQENARFDRLHDAYTRQLEVLAEYRAALIHECVTGQRIVPEVANA